MSNKESKEMVEVFTKYITVKGRKIYCKNGKCFHFWAPKKDKVGA